MSVIATMIEKRQKELAEKKEYEDRERAEFLEQAKTMVEQCLGELHGEFEPYSGRGHYLGSQGSAQHLPNQLEWPVDHPVYGQFTLKAVVNLGVGESGKKVPLIKEVMVRADGMLTDISNKARLAECFMEMQRRTATDRVATVKRLANALKYPHHLGEDKFEEVVARLIELDPDNAAAYQRQLQEKVQADAKAAAAKQQEEEARKAVAEAYRAVWQTWRNAYAQAAQANKDKLDELQAAYDSPFPLWELKYAAVARDDEETAVEDHSVYVLRPDTLGGMWQRWDVWKEQPVLTRFFNPVALVVLGLVRPTESEVHVSVKPSAIRDCDAIRIPPAWWDCKAAVQQEVDAAMLPLPPRPNWEDFPGLNHNDARLIEEAVLSE